MATAARWQGRRVGVGTDRDEAQAAAKRSTQRLSARMPARMSGRTQSQSVRRGHASGAQTKLSRKRAQTKLSGRICERAPVVAVVPQRALLRLGEEAA
eukprot:2432347-Pleurochrysis_carterae.AAC.2